MLFGPLERDREEEGEGIVGLLSLPPGASVVDLGCGRGRHAIPLSRRGYRVTGVDLSEKMLGLARERAQREGASVVWVREDMRKFVRRGAFDACLSLFTSFGFFNDEENELVIGNVAKSPKEGGTTCCSLPLLQRQFIAVFGSDFSLGNSIQHRYAGKMGGGERDSSPSPK